MKKVIVLFVLILVSSTIVSAQEWQTDISEAHKKAKERNQNIVLVFSGSDWCASCIRLEREILSSDEFKKYAKENVVLLRADFPKKQKNKLPKEQQEKNNKLALKYNQEGHFPLVVVLNSDMKVLGITGYNSVSPAEYIKKLSSF